MKAESAKRSPIEGDCMGPTAGLLALLWVVSRGELRGVLKLACRSCSARLARSSATAILCTAPCMAGQLIQIPTLTPQMTGGAFTWRVTCCSCSVRLMRSSIDVFLCKTPCVGRDSFVRACIAQAQLMALGCSPPELDALCSRSL